jgi:hypothetical protein
MLKSASIGELVKAIAEAQADYGALLATHTAKIPGKDGKSGYEYQYADLNDGLAALQKTLNNRGVAVVQEAYTVDRGIEVVTTLALGEQWIEARPLFMPVQGNAQAVGSAITYARRYSLFPMVGLAPADDDGGEAERNAPPPKPKATPKPKPATHEAAPADGLGPRCTGKAAGISKAIGDRMRPLVALRKGKATEVWADALAEAGVDVSKYGATMPRSEALTIADGQMVAEYLARLLDEQPADMEALRNECSKLWVQIVKGPDGYSLDDWRPAWAAFAGGSQWPDQPTAADYKHAIAGMRGELERISA